MTQSNDDLYEIQNQIGRGSYATVYKAINIQTGELCAIKKIPVTASFELNNFITEVGILKHCDCRNIVRFLGHYNSKREVSIVMEYCLGGSVKDVMRQLNCTMNQDQITLISKDALNGLSYLHSSKKIHRDIKAANILLDDKGVAKLGDFGVSEPSDSSARKRSIIGTLLWLPPEVLNQDPHYSPVIDIWSLGITIIEMAEGQPPYHQQEQSVALAEIKNLEKTSPNFSQPDAWSCELVDFLSQCLIKDATKRKSALELVNHELFNNLPSREVMRTLVDEVKPINFKGGELDSISCRRIECLLKECSKLFGTYKERKMKIVRVDTLTRSLKEVEDQFRQKQEMMMTSDSKVTGLKRQVDLLSNENDNYKRDLNELNITLNDLEKRKNWMLSELAQIQNRLKQIETTADVNRRKLRALEAYSK